MTGTWAEFAAAFAIFLASHMIPTRPGIKAAAQTALGKRGFTTAYSVLSLVLLAWLIIAAKNAPFILLWDQAEWQRWAVNLIMPLAILMAVFAIGAPNPLSFGGRAAGFIPEHPGIAGIARHPLLWALALWSAAHLLVNGDLAHALLFGSFAAFALFGMRAIDKRNQRQMGPAIWQALARNTSALPFAALILRRWRPASWPNPRRAALAVLIWATLLLLHLPVIGVSPMP